MEEKNTDQDLGGVGREHRAVPSTESPKTSELKAAHTPGPWRVVRQGRGRILLKPETDGVLGTQIAQLFAYQDPSTENVANARLIAAAPDLYEALSNLYDAIDSSVELTPEVLKKARAALALVNGQDPNTAKPEQPNPIR